MKILCDVCNKQESTVFCPADEAALCGGCDQRVHGANKLAGKHHRHPLSPQATPPGSPLCDICQERRALFFCREDRAIFCRECDLHIHSPHQHTRSHSRFLLTGVVNSRDDEYGATGSSISEYFTKTLPGWRVDDFLDPHPPQFNGYCKTTILDEGRLKPRDWAPPKPHEYDKRAGPPSQGTKGEASMPRHFGLFSFHHARATFACPLMK
ncbi:hypothetical protein MLD38_027034 [Melastoma candidum]|uniref:Uncharacterized protein n=1 Tax=Melastoma candidum TaxID=119954 RepID=A0ACB9P0X3_9MYRT|nr:hypothetical protein MLD38_027034 [Melastoma candidum]